MQLKLNGRLTEIPSTVPPEMPLLWVLREQLGLTGTKYACGHGVCGACIVMIDGTQAHACQMKIQELAGKDIVTIEGQSGPIAEALFSAWNELDVAQCGFCQPAQITSATILLQHVSRPTDADIDEAMKHNLCRCATYQRIRRAIHLTATRLERDKGAAL